MRWTLVLRAYTCVKALIFFKQANIEMRLFPIGWVNGGEQSKKEMSRGEIKELASELNDKKLGK